MLEVEDLRVGMEGTDIDIVEGISFAVAAGELLGLVGESGSGKTTVGLALLGHTRRGARIAGGQVRIAGSDILRLPPEKLRALRGRTVSYVPQDPGAALNPALRIRRQLEETLVAHGFGTSHDELRARVDELLGEVLLPRDTAFLRRYPHQLSGGQQQRVALATAFACRPRVIVLDEPTTGLDVTTQAHVLDTVRELCDTHNVAAVYISHDLAVIASVANRVAVMYAGRIVELGPERVLFRDSAHPYTRRLIETIPELSGRHALEGIAGTPPRPGHRPAGCSFAPRCTYAVERCDEELPPVSSISETHVVRCFRQADVRADAARERRPAAPRPQGFPSEALMDVREVAAAHGDRQVLFDVSITLHPRECLALVGESGSGKTTLARCIAGLHPGFTGAIELGGRPLAPDAHSRDGETRRLIQYVFQSPYSSLNPRKTVGQIVDQPLSLFFELGRRDRYMRIVAALERVQLDPSVVPRYPGELSGGERQRVAIARALAAEPTLLVCDEVTSALDVSVQAAIVDLLAELQREMQLSLLFATHNLALVRTIADEVAVMRAGRIIEFGKVDDVLSSPQQDYTKALLADTPSMETALACSEHA